MGVNFKDLFEKKELSFAELKNKTVAVDSFNILYQFLTTIRQPDGTPLMNAEGKITSHLNGLFYRTTKLLSYGIKPVFVFDGEAPELKKAERKRRKQLKEEASIKYEAAKHAEDIAGMKKFASRTAYLTPEMVEDAKQLITALGLPIVQAPSEGEAQAAHMTRAGDTYAVVSQDYDSLLSGAPRVIQNLSVAGKKKVAGKLSYKTMNPELIELQPNLKRLGISQDQLIALALLVGTDYNYGGIKGLGPKKALKLVKENGDDFDKLFSSVSFDEQSPHPWKAIFDTIKHMPVTSKYSLMFHKINTDKIEALLVDTFHFSKERVQNTLKQLQKQACAATQSSLTQF